MKHISYALPFVILAACAPVDTTRMAMNPTLPSVGADTCGAREHAGFLGQPVQAMHDSAILKPVRIIRPNTAVTMDFLETRVNIYLDDTDRIEAISCG